MWCWAATQRHPGGCGPESRETRSQADSSSGFDEVGDSLSVLGVVDDLWSEACGVAGAKNLLMARSISTGQYPPVLGESTQFDPV